jgi:hypothetical protein
MPVILTSWISPGLGFVMIENPQGTAAWLHAWGCISSTQ